MDELDDFVRLLNEGVIDEEEMDEVLDLYLVAYSTRRIPQLRSVRYGYFNLNRWTDDEVRSKFRFTREHLHLLVYSTYPKK